MNDEYFWSLPRFQNKIWKHIGLPPYNYNLDRKYRKQPIKRSAL